MLDLGDAHGWLPWRSAAKLADDSLARHGRPI
jgi:hypothetical protein